METNQRTPAYSLVPLDESRHEPPTYACASTSTSNGPQAGDQTDQENDEMVGQAAPLQNKLPSYEQATTLPSYDEIQKEKEDEARADLINFFFGVENDNELHVDGLAVGSDCTFIFAFLMAFFFNWLGFFIGYCILLNLAGRYGAVSGFGLSVINWLVYLKYSQVETEYFTEERLFMWWFFFLLGCLLVVKGIINWFKVRKVLYLTPEERENSRLLVLY